jgi:uncharacterized protein involved in exopolysaccharide biosynthesis
VITDKGHSIIPPHPIEAVATVEQFGAPSPGSVEEDIDATRFLRAVARNWILISAIILIFSAGSFALASWTPTTYEASAMLVLSAPRETSGLPRTAATVRALLTNSGVVNEALRGTVLEQSTNAAEFVRAALFVDDVPGGQFVRLRVRARDSKLAATLTKSLVDGAAAQAARVDERAGTTGEQLKVQLDRAAERMAEAGNRLLDYQQRSHPNEASSEVQAILRERRELLEIPLESERGQDRFPGAAGLAAPGEQRRRALTEAEVKQLETLSARELEMIRLRTDFFAAGLVYSELGLRYEKARSDALDKDSILVLVDGEIAPGAPLPRGRLRKTVLGFVIGLLVAVAFVVIREAQDPARRVFAQ